MVMTIISSILGLATLLLGGYLAKVKAVVKEFADIPEAVEKALADDKITADELKDILKQIREFVNSLGLLMKFK